MDKLADILADALAAGERAILVRVERAVGSTPRGEDAAMIVTAGATAGSIGGGAVEHRAIAHARALLGEVPRQADRTVLPLGPAIGQCCGGRVHLRFLGAGAGTLDELRAAERRERDTWPFVLVVGAGHVGRALSRALAPLPLRHRVVDARADQLALLESDVERRQSALYEAEVAAAPPGSGFVIATHDHGLDFEAARAALGREDARYVGLIGSATKRARFAGHLRRSGDDPRLIDRLTLPIGGTRVADKRPAVIAALVAAELLERLLGAEAEVSDRDLMQSDRRSRVGP